MTSQSIPIESTVLYSRLKKSEPWARIYLILLDFFEKGKYNIIAKEIEEASQFRISSSYAWQLLDVLFRMKLVGKLSKTGRDSFTLSELLFFEKEKMKLICEKTIAKKKELI